MKGVYIKGRTSVINTPLTLSTLENFPLASCHALLPLHPSVLSFSGPLNLSLREAREKSKFLSSSAIQQFSHLLLLPFPARPGDSPELEPPPFSSQRPPKAVPNQKTANNNIKWSHLKMELGLPCQRDRLARLIPQTLRAEEVQESEVFA